jgi:hypothetical protein
MLASKCSSSKGTPTLTVMDTGRRVSPLDNQTSEQDALVLFKK